MPADRTASRTTNRHQSHVQRGARRNARRQRRQRMLLIIFVHMDEDEGETVPHLWTFALVPKSGLTNGTTFNTIEVANDPPDLQSGRDWERITMRRRQVGENWEHRDWHTMINVCEFTSDLEDEFLHEIPRCVQTSPEGGDWPNALVDWLTQAFYLPEQYAQQLHDAMAWDNFDTYDELFFDQNEGAAPPAARANRVHVPNQARRQAMGIPDAMLPALQAMGRAMQEGRGQDVFRIAERAVEQTGWRAPANYDEQMEREERRMAEGSEASED